MGVAVAKQPAYFSARSPVGCEVGVARNIVLVVSPARAGVRRTAAAARAARSDKPLDGMMARGG
jgi:hypothetical protein